MNNNKLITNFLRYLVAKNISKSSLKYYKSDISNFLSWAHNRKVDNKLVQEYINSQRLTTPVSTLNRRLSTLRSYANFVDQDFMSGIENVSTLGKVSKSLRDKIISKFESRPKIKNVLHSIFFNRPNWYKKYHSYSVANYIHIAILVLFTSISGYAVYDQIFQTTDNLLAFPSTLERPNRFLSFQGRLTDDLGNPETTATPMIFKLYNVSTGGTELWSSGSCSITPDQDGIFSTLLGSSCGAEIDSSVFSENSDIWLGVQVDTDAEATPRIQIATVAYALNSETLQGFPAGTAESTIPYIDTTGTMILTNASPKIQSTSGTFAIEGQAITIITPNTSDGIVTINPDGVGTLDLTFEGAAPGLSANGFVNATNANITSGSLYAGTVNSDATGYNFINFVSGLTPTSKFSVDAAGNTLMAGDLTISGGNLTTGNIAFVFGDATTDSIQLLTDGTGDGEVLLPNNSIGPNEVLTTGQTDEYCLTYEETGATWEWQECGTGGGSSVWSDLTDPAGNLSLNHTTYTTTFNWDTGTGTNDLFSLTTDASSNGTGSLLNLQTGAGSTVSPIRIRAGSLEALFVNNISNVGIGTITPISKLSVINNPGAGNYTGKAAFLVDQYESEDILTASASGVTKLTLQNDGTLKLYDATSTISNDAGDITVEPTSGILSLIGNLYVSLGISTYANTVSDGTVEATKFCTGDGETNCITDFSAVIAGSSLFTDGGAVTYLTSETDDFAIGGTTLAASMFGIDESAGNFYFGYDNSANPTLNFEATDGDAGEFGFNTNDAFYISNANFGVGTTGPDARIDSLATSGEQLRLSYTDGSVYSGFTVDSNGYMAIDPTGSRVAIDGSLQVGSTSPLAYSRFGTATTGHAGNITASDDILVSGDVELNGTLFLDGGTIANSGGIAAVVLSSTPVTTYNSLSAGSWLIENTENVGQAALMVNQTKSNALFTASASGTTKFTIANNGNITATGTITGLTGVTSSGTINFSTLTASRAIFTDASSNLAATGTSAMLLNALTDETGTGVSVFSTSPQITTSLTTDSTTFSLINTTATTVHFAGAATTLNMGAGGSLTRTINIGTGTGADTINIGTGGTGSDVIAIGGGVGTLAINTGDWDVSTTGAMTGISGITTDGAYTQSGTSANTMTGTTTFSNATYSALFTGGNVGIGTTAPAAKLHIIGTSTTNLSAAILENSSNANNTTKSVSLDFRGVDTVGTSKNVGQILAIPEDVNWVSAALAFHTRLSDGAPAERMRITSAGNVGIGTTGPSGRLTVAGSTGDSRSVSIDNREIKFRGDAVAHMSILGPDTGKSYITIQNTSTNVNTGIAGTDLFTILSTGNVGIGTTAPGNALHVERLGFNPAANDLAAIRVYGNYGGGLVFSEGTGRSGIWSGNGTDLRFGTGGNASGIPDRMFIKADGQVGIGTLDPQAKLHIVPTVSSEAIRMQADDVYISGFNTAGTTRRGYIQWTTADLRIANELNGPTIFYTNSTEKMRLTSDGKLGIGNNSPSYTLDVIGSGGFVGHIAISDTNAPLINYYRGGAATDEKFWRTLTANDGTASYFGIQTVNDAYNSAANGLLIYRSGTTITKTLLYGNVGIGTSSPSSDTNLHVVASGNRAAQLYTPTLADYTSGVVISTGSTASSAKYFLSMQSGVGGTPDTEFIFRSDGVGLSDGGWTTPASDFAEYFETNDTSLDKGHIVTLNKTDDKKIAYGNKSSYPIGVVSTQPGFVGGFTDLKETGVDRENHPNWKVIGLLGQVPTFVSNENGIIKKGDPIALSSVAGIGAKAVKATNIVGYAMEDYEGDETGKILVFVQPTWYDPDTYLSSTGDVVLSGDSVADYEVSTPQGLTYKIGAFRDATIARLKAGFGSFKKIETNIISPVANSDLIIDLSATESGKLVVTGQNNEEVASIDSTGLITANNLEIEANATISGTLYANNIESEKLKEIEELLREVEINQGLLAESASWNTNTATESGQFSQLIANSIQTTELFVTGQAAISSLFISDILTTNKIDSLDMPLKIQSLASSSLEIMAGRIIIDTEGNTKFLGNVEIAGNLTINNIIVANNTEPVTEESVVTEGIINTNATAGKAILSANSEMVRINNSKIKENTLVYLTPISSTQNKVLFVKSKGTGYFEAGFSDILDTDVEFNWWIIELEQIAQEVVNE